MKSPSLLMPTRNWIPTLARDNVENDLPAADLEDL